MTACGAVSNATAGTVINPVQSARLTTKNSHHIQYGKVEVVAKLPRGDWMWPAIWMLPVDDHYGPWPASGEIDIMESRGNNAKYKAQGRDVVRGSLNWGPFSWLNGVSKTYGWWNDRRHSYDEGFHTYSMEWNEKFIRMYVDTRLHHLLEVSFNKPFFQRGDFPPYVANGSQTIATPNPWMNGTNASPFDKPFYLILNVAVGGTNGWFPDGIGDKPWFDGSLSAFLCLTVSCASSHRFHRRDAGVREEPGRVERDVAHGRRRPRHGRRLGQDVAEVLDISRVSLPHTSRRAPFSVIPITFSALVVVALSSQVTTNAYSILYSYTHVPLPSLSLSLSHTSIELGVVV